MGRLSLGEVILRVYKSLNPSHLYDKAVAVKNIDYGQRDGQKIIHLSQSEMAMLAELNRRASGAQDGGA